MPPKGRLPRRAKAPQGALNLEAVSEERIDAVTAEPLDPVRFVEVLSPDQTLRLFYNTSTLVRIAVDNGGFMQPPHFREPMSNALRKRVEEVEGKKFHFESRGKLISTGEAGDGGAAAVLHRHVYFDQIMDEFYLLSPAELYVCPVCYEHYLKTRFLPSRMEEGHVVHHLRSGQPVVDPLDALAHMQSDDPMAAEAESGAPIVLDPVWDNVLVHIVFRRAAQWRAHMEAHHEVSGVNAGDYRLRDVLCTYYNDYNQLNDEKYNEEVNLYGSGKRKVALTLQRYWHVNASYNRLRYNRVVAATELAEGHPEAVTASAFPNETVAHHFNPENEDDDDFIDDSSSEGGDYVRPYSPAQEGFVEEEEEGEEEEEEEEELRGQRPVRSARKRSRTSREKAVSVASDLTPSSSSTTSTDSEYDAEVERQRALFKRGLLAERDCYYSRLSAEDRLFFQRSQRANVAPSQLYDPRMHQVPSASGYALYEEIDWENIGEPLATKSALKVRKEEPNALGSGASGTTPTKTQLLLDEDETPLRRGDPPPQPATNPQPARILLDEDE